MKSLIQLIADYSEAVSRYGIFSESALRIRGENANYPQFVTFADALDRIKRTLDEPKIGPELTTIENVVNQFAFEMKTKLFLKQAEGYTGWDQAENLSEIRSSLRRHIERCDDNQAIDIANLAMMIWWIGQIRRDQG